MCYWRQDCFESLKDIASKCGGEPAWADFASFCVDYERGLRKRAFTTLDRFISDLERADFDERLRFIRWLLPEAESRDGRHMLLPFPLVKRIVEPTIAEWLDREPNCAKAHCWQGDYEHLKRAIELDPCNQIARRRLLTMVLRGIDYATHELPWGYLGNAKEDLAELDIMVDVARGLTAEGERARVLACIESHRQEIDHYLQRRT